jgi:hypothetical protein
MPPTPAVSTPKPQGIPDGYQVLKENAPSFALGSGGFYVAFAPVLNAKANAASAADSALGAVATGAAQLVVPTKQEQTAATAGAAVASIGSGFRGFQAGYFGP